MWPEWPFGQCSDDFSKSKRFVLHSPLSAYVLDRKIQATAPSVWLEFCFFFFPIFSNSFVVVYLLFHFCLDHNLVFGE